MRVTPFTIKLLREPATTFTQPLTLGVDAGSKTAGFGVTDINGDVCYASEVEMRQDITRKMEQRRAYRRNRRSRKCRYRKPQFDNRRNSTRAGRLSPTIRSKIDSQLKEIGFIERILPISTIIIEAGTFDPHALKDPSVLSDLLLYQQGMLYGHNNIKAFVLDRDGYTCQYCKGRSGDKHLHCHHIIFRENGGSDDPENMIVLCRTCHDALHRGEFLLPFRGKHRGALNHATHQNIINKRLLKSISGAAATFGYIMKTNREALHLPKTHCNDAVVIASKGIPATFKNDANLIKKCVSRGDYQQTKGARSEKRIPTRKLFGFKKFDKVRYRGTTCFIKGRRSTGYFALMDINGSSIPFKPTPKANLMQRMEARKTWITMAMPDSSPP